MNIIISNSSPDPIYEQIKKQIKTQIIVGDLKEGEALPSMRKLAQELQISLITTKRAYEDLEREGFIDSVGGKGTFISAQNQDFLREKRMRIVEDLLNKAIDESKLLNITKTELKNMLDLLYDDDDDKNEYEEYKNMLEHGTAARPKII
jgi:GntR family transcriptional regulator